MLDMQHHCLECSPAQVRSSMAPTQAPQAAATCDTLYLACYQPHPMHATTCTVCACRKCGVWSRRCSGATSPM
jgi:hypothetical protein